MSGAVTATHRGGQTRRRTTGSTGRLSALLLGLALLGAACGDDGASSGTATGQSGAIEAAELAEGTDGASDTHPIEAEQERVVAAHEAAMHARIESGSGPDPSHEGVTDTHTDPLLSEWQGRLEGMDNQGLAIRYPDDSELEVLDVIDVSFSWADGADGSAEAGAGDVGDTATLRVCILDDGETYNVASGEVTAGGGLFTVYENAVLRKIDGEWRLAERTATEREGRVGCAEE